MTLIEKIATMMSACHSTGMNDYPALLNALRKLSEENLLARIKSLEHGEHFLGWAVKDWSGLKFECAECEREFVTPVRQGIAHCPDCGSQAWFIAPIPQ